MSVISETETGAHADSPWAPIIFEALQQANVRQVSYVPDAGHARLIRMCSASETMKTIVLTTEEEGIALCTGAWLGGERSALLMQSSGVGNCVNMLSVPAECDMPLVMLVTMRGEWGEFNPWQIAMGQSTAAVLEASGVIVYRCDAIEDIGPTVEAAMSLAFQSRRRVAVLVSQRLLGAKNFARGDK
jgi:sulfopyruvate decarboxylase alpha subunit